MRLPSGEVARCIEESVTQGAPEGAQRLPGGSGGSGIAPRRHPGGSKIAPCRLPVLESLDGRSDDSWATEIALLNQQAREERLRHRAAMAQAKPASPGEEVADADRQLMPPQGTGVADEHEETCFVRQRAARKQRRVRQQRQRDAAAAQSRDQAFLRETALARAHVPSRPLEESAGQAVQRGRTRQRRERAVAAHEATETDQIAQNLALHCWAAQLGPVRR